MVDISTLVADLTDESEELDALVAGLTPGQWAMQTPAPGWDIARQIAHLLWTDRVALLSVHDEAGFVQVLTAAAANPAGFVDAGAEDLAALAPDQLLAQWRATRRQLHSALGRVAPGRKLPWFGPPMSAASMATARLMETWAHGFDVADALEVTRAPSARLRAIAHLGVRTRDYAFNMRGLPVPNQLFHVELTAPDGTNWAWGPADATQRVSGSAADFCALVTKRRALSDLDVAASGPDATRWLQIAQAFAGPPGVGR